MIKLTKKYVYGILAVALYQTIPLFLVMSSVGSYVPVNTFTMFLITYFYFFKPNSNLEHFLIGLFAGLTNYKLFVVILPIIFREIIVRKSLIKAMLNKIFVGFILGNIIWWAYGMIINFKYFVLIHLILHWIEPFTINNFNLNQVFYKWIGIIFHVNIFFFLIALIFLIFLIIKSRTNKLSLFFYWFVIVGLSVSMAKGIWFTSRNFLFLMPSLIIPVFCVISNLNKKYRIILFVVLGVIILTILYTI